MNNIAVIELPASADALRALLHERFPEAHAPARADDRACLQTGCRDLDAIGLAKGSVAEVVQIRPSSGGALLVARLIAGASTNGQRLALVDGRDSFDPGSARAESLQNLLWIRATSATESLKATDFLLRDGNLPLVLLDLALTPRGEVTRIPDSSWQRLRALAEKTSTSLLAITPAQCVPRPHLRIHLGHSFTLAAFDHSREELTLSLQTTRSVPTHNQFTKIA